MSGFAAIVHLDGAPAAVELIGAMAGAMAFRGPDGQRIWRSGPVALAHAAFHTTPEAPHWPQPLSLDGRFTIAGDVRLDEIADLRSRLAAAGETPPPGADDSLLLLHSYRAWGRECLRHLAGDFSFALWDAQERRLFCGRDQLGVKPLFYAHVGNAFVFSNTLECVLLHPALSDELDESTVADFLLFRGCLRDPEATIYRQVRRLAPAHSLEVAANPRLARYWELPWPDAATQRRKPRDCAEEFRHRFTASVRDRLRTPSVAVTLSGGVDSTAVAAEARRLMGDGFPMHAHTVGFRRLFDDPEPAWAEQAARSLGMDFHLHTADEYRLFASNAVPSTEPFFDPGRSLWLEVFRAAALHSKVVLTGEGGDVLFLPSVVGDGLGWRHIAAIWRYACSTRHLPQIGLRNALGINRSPDFAYPACFDPDFERRQRLRERWNDAQRRQENGHPRRKLYANLAGNFWPQFLTGMDASLGGIAVEFRHPFFSRQLIEFMLTVPDHLLDVFDKRLLRDGLAPQLPEAIRVRRKTPLAADDLQLKLEGGEWDQIATRPAHPAILAYVKDAALVSLRPGVPAQDWQPLLAAISLNCWLHTRTPVVTGVVPAYHPLSSLW